MQDQTSRDLSVRLGDFAAEIPHLARRFFGFVTAAPLSPREQAEADALLAPASAALFWAQPRQDQRHGVDVMHAVLRSRPGDRLAAETALLHDVGKRHSRLGAIGRSAATAAAAGGLPLPARWVEYLRHGELGASDLAAAGSDSFIVEFTRIHPGPPPAGVDVARWQAIASADQDAA